ncbi:MAG: LysE family translocator, partial [Deltaproteobacteria bacterium]|nr:LysE family translocator [Deltaproteobacteria bacterium]
MISLLSAGLIFGLSAGFSPGPLLMLVISQTLQHGIKEGVKVAAAPLLTDLPIIIASLAVLSRLADFKPVLGLISLAGGIFVAYMAWGNFRTSGLETAANPAAPKSLLRGVAANALNPHPYLFWLTVGGPTMIGGWREGFSGVFLFLAVFFVCIVGSKMLIAVLVGRSKQFLKGRVYRGIMVALGILLALLAFFLIREGF